MKIIIIILFHCSFAIVLLLLGYIIMPNHQLSRIQRPKNNLYNREYVIVQFYVEKGEIHYHKRIESLSDYDLAMDRLEAFPSAGFFWTGLHEYKIVECVDGEYKKCFNGNSLHNKYLKIAENF